ncbi:hypothetical protein VUR80DRAFT_5121 [Thermomyces stellatus]
MSDQSLGQIKTYSVPDGIETAADFAVEVRPLDSHGDAWTRVPTLAVEVASINTTSSVFNKHCISVASLDIRGPIQVRATYKAGPVATARVRPASYGIDTTVENDAVTFALDNGGAVMVEINGDKRQALHLLINEIDESAPTGDDEGTWYFGPGINNGSASSRIKDGDLDVPDGVTVYLSGGAFLTARLNFRGVSGAGVRGHGFIYKPGRGAILIERSRNIRVQGVTSIGATGFSLTTGEAHGVHIDRYRSFSSAGNGDGLDFFCSTDVLAERCFLRNSDDTVAIYGHRWDYYGDTRDITVRDCVLLPDIAHPLHMGTHGCPEKPETMSRIRISNIDILDHEENQLWYQGCISINAGDGNLIEDVHVEDVRVEKVTKGQLVNLRVMQNARWTTAPGRGIRDVVIKNLRLNMEDSEVVNPSQVLGLDGERYVENVTFEDLRVGDRLVYEGMPMPHWYMVADMVPLFANEHVKNLTFVCSLE